MPDLAIRDASKDEIKQIAQWLLEDRTAHPMFAGFANRGWRRFLYEKLVTPRYLRASHTWALEQDGKLAGYAVVQPTGGSVYVADLAVHPGYDRLGLAALVLAEADSIARRGDYRFVRASPWDVSEEGLAPYLAAGYRQLDYYLSVFTGQVGDVEAPAGVTLFELRGRQALAQRLHYLRLELDETPIAGRELIDAAYLPTQPPSHQAFEIKLAAGDGDAAAEPIGYLAPRPNERGDGVMTLVVSLIPRYWGSQLEASIVGAFASEAGRDEPPPVRVLISTTAHADCAEPALAAVGLQRELDVRPILFKELAGTEGFNQPPAA